MSSSVQPANGLSMANNHPPGNQDLDMPYSLKIINALDHYRAQNETLLEGMSQAIATLQASRFEEFQDNLARSIEMLVGSKSKLFDTLNETASILPHLSRTQTILDSFGESFDFTLPDRFIENLGISQIELEKFALNMHILPDDIFDSVGVLAAQAHISRIAEASYLGLETTKLLDSNASISVDFSTPLNTLVSSADNVLKALDRFESGIFSHLPVLSEMPVFEVFAQADVTALLFDSELENPVEDRRLALRESIYLDGRNSLSDCLVTISPDLPDLWNGATTALSSTNPDRARHISTSLRELLTNVLHSLSPDLEVKSWNNSPALYHGGRPTRRARILYICREINVEPFEDFVTNDVEAFLELMDLLQSGTHGVGVSYSTDQLSAMITRAGNLIRSLLGVSGH